MKECGGLEVGAAVTLSRLEEVLRAQMSCRPAFETSGFKAVVEQLRWFAGRQIRNVGTLGGNICTASPISDLNPLWMAMGASFVVVAQGGKERQVRGGGVEVGGEVEEEVGAKGAGVRSRTYMCCVMNRGGAGGGDRGVWWPAVDGHGGKLYGGGGGARGKRKGR